MAQTHHPPPQGYHDGLILSEQPYPEVYVSDPAQKPMPALPASPPQWNQSRQRSQSQSHASVPPSSYHQTHQDYHHPEQPERRPFWKKKITWVIVASVVILAILAGILGAMASGAIKTSGNKDSRYEKSNQLETRQE
jgi:hypothetical protein